MIVKACYSCIVISSFPPLFLFHFLAMFGLCLTSCSFEKCKALMIGKLSENADPPKQLDSVSERLFVFVLYVGSVKNTSNSIFPI